MQKAYLEALDYTKTFQTGSEGYSAYNAESLSDKTIIKQNNTIIRLILKIYERIEDTEQKLANQIEEVEKKLQKLEISNFQDNLSKITDKLGSVKLEPTGKEQVTRKPVIFTFPTRPLVKEQPSKPKP